MQVKWCVAIAASLCLVACETKDKDDRFLEQPIGQQITKADTMPTSDVYRLYKRALVVRPGTRSLAEVLSRRGDEARAAVISDINVGSEFVYPSHYLPVLEGLCNFGHSCYCNDKKFKNELVSALRKHNGYYRFSVQKLDAGETEFGKACQYQRSSN